MNLKDKILQYGSFLLVFLAPLVFLNHRLYPHISTKTFFIYGIVQIIFFIWIYTLTVDKSYRLPKRVLVYFLPPICFVLWMTIAGIFAVNPGLALWSSLGRGTGLLTLYHLLALSFVVASLVSKNGLLYVISLFKWFTAGSFILALSVWLGTEGFNLPIKVLQTDAGGGLAGNSTLTAGYLLFTFAIGAFLLAIKNLSKTQKWLVGITLFLALFSPVFINLYGSFVGKGILGLARGTILALLVGVLFTGLGYMFLSSKKWVKGASIAVFVIGLASFVFLWAQLVTPNTYLYQKFAEEARGTRFIFWDTAEIAMNRNPILGYGPENYFMAFQENFNPQVLLEENSFEGWADRAHNIYYDLGVSGGYPAIAFYIIFILSMIYASYRLYKNGQINRIQASILAGLLVAYVSNLLFTFDSTISLMGLFMMAGILYSFNQGDIKQKSLPVNIDQSSKNIIALGAFVLFVTSFIFFTLMPSIKSKAYAETFAAPINKRAEMYPKLLGGSPVGSHWDISDLAFKVYRLYASNPAQLKNDKEKAPYLIKDLEALLDYLYKVSENNKTDYRLYITIASLENTLTYMSSRPYTIETRDKILEILEKAQALSPTNPNVYWTRAQTKIWGSDFAGVEEAYREAIDVAPHFPASYNLSLRYAQIVGNQKLFNEIMIQAKENIPGYEFK